MRHKAKLQAEINRFQFSFSTGYLIKVKNPRLPRAGGDIVEFIPLPRVSTLFEMRIASTRIWTRVSVSISHENNHFITRTFIYMWGDICMRVWEWIWVYMYDINTLYSLVWFYGISTRLFNAKSSLCIYIKYLISKHILLITFLNEPGLIVFHTVKWF